MIYKGIISIADNKGQRGAVTLYIDPRDVNSDPVDPETCLSLIAGFAEALLSGAAGVPLIAGRVVGVQLQIEYDVSTLIGNPAVPGIHSDVEEQVRLTGRTESGHVKSWIIPAINEESLNPNGTLFFDTWEHALLFLDNNGLSLPGVFYNCDQRGSRIEIGSVSGVEWWGKRRK